MTPPYTFTGPYANCYRNRSMCMDERHVYTIFDVLTGWPFENVLELGCYDGASSTAFIEARLAGMSGTITLCDAHISDSLKSVVSKSSRFVNTMCNLSWNVLATAAPFDFILVDANHDLESVSKELDQILRRVPLCVMAHDTNATRMGYPAAEGAQHLADTLRKHPAYRGKCIEDAVRRSGEETHRGLFFATTDQELYEKARAIFAARCPELEAIAA